VTKNFYIVNSNIRRIALQPGVRGGMGRVARGNDDNLFGAPLAIAGLGAAPASLSPNPKNLFVLWQESQIGIGGQKAAKRFTQSERGGKTKHKYSRRKVIWLMVRGMVKLGQTADSAINQIALLSVWTTNLCYSDYQFSKKTKKRGLSIQTLEFDLR
jgi:hypothetical protein